jgi:hypothetical protein
LNKFKKTTIIILIAVTAILIIWDLITYNLDGSNSTISKIILGTSGKWFTLPFAWGILTGHLFIPRKMPENMKLFIIIMSVIFVTVLLLDIFLPFNVFPIIPLGLGILSGWYFVPQPKK